jgi:heme oxygenase
VTESPLELVRRVTNERHERVEQLTHELRVLASVEAFRRHLQILHQHHTRELRRVVHHVDLRPLVEQRVNELAHDIAQLGSAVPDDHNNSEAPLAYAQAVGVTYVIEGSRLGAFAISKRLNKNGITTEKLQSVGGQLPAIRQRFATTASRINSLEPHDAQVMANEAERCFNDLLTAYAAWFDERPHGA